MSRSHFMDNQARRGALCQGIVTSIARTGHSGQFGPPRRHERHGLNKNLRLPCASCIRRPSIHEIDCPRSCDTDVTRSKSSRNGDHGRVLGGLPNSQGAVHFLMIVIWQSASGTYPRRWSPRQTRPNRSQCSWLLEPGTISIGSITGEDNCWMAFHWINCDLHRGRGRRQLLGSWPPPEARPVRGEARPLPIWKATG